MFQKSGDVTLSENGKYYPLDDQLKEDIRRFEQEHDATVFLVVRMSTMYGTPDSPYGCPRWVGDSLEELEWWLESIADDYDSLGDVPGWEVQRTPLSLSRWMKNDVLVTMSADKNFVGIKTYDRKHGTRGRFLINRSAISELLEASKGTTRYESDCGDYAKITRLSDHLYFSFAWLKGGLYLPPAQSTG